MNISVSKNNHALSLHTAEYIDGFMPERCISIANALGLRLSCTDPSIYGLHICDVFFYLVMLGSYVQL